MTGSLQEHFRLFALYSRWANGQIDEAAAQLTPAALRDDRGGYFRSVLGVLNHLLVTDGIWLRRLRQEPPEAVALDTILHEDFDALLAARRARAQTLIDFVFGLSEAQLGEPVNYASLNGTKFVDPVGRLLTHLFNHQTHHRGQAHDLIGQILGRDKVPTLDLIVYQRYVAPTDAP